MPSAPPSTRFVFIMSEVYDLRQVYSMCFFCCICSRGILHSRIIVIVPVEPARWPRTLRNGDEIMAEQQQQQIGRSWYVLLCTWTYLVFVVSGSFLHAICVKFVSIDGWHHAQHALFKAPLHFYVNRTWSIVSSTITIATWTVALQLTRYPLSLYPIFGSRYNNKIRLIRSLWRLWCLWLMYVVDGA